MWHAHDHVVLGESNRRMKGCVDLQCGHDRVVCNVTCSWSCSTRQIKLKIVWFFVLCTIGPSIYDFNTHRHTSGGWSSLVYIGTEELPCKLLVRKMLPISWSQGANNALHRPLWFYPTTCHSCWPTIPQFTVSSLEAQPLGRVPPLPSPPAAASSRYVNPSPKSKVCLCLQALADTTICRWILGMALIREIHYIWDEMVAREMERRLILLQQSDNESRSWLLKACPVLIRD
jgi:hypothetical protein